MQIQKTIELKMNEKYGSGGIERGVEELKIDMRQIKGEINSMKTDANGINEKSRKMEYQLEDF